MLLQSDDLWRQATKELPSTRAGLAALSSRSSPLSTVLPLDVPYTHHSLTTLTSQIFPDGVQP